MPVMPRSNKKATKIAFDILGTPANYLEKKTARQKKIDRRLLFHDTARVR